MTSFSKNINKRRGQVAFSTAHWNLKLNPDRVAFLNTALLSLANMCYTILHRLNSIHTSSYNNCMADNRLAIASKLSGNDDGGLLYRRDRFITIVSYRWQHHNKSAESTIRWCNSQIQTVTTQRKVNASQTMHIPFPRITSNWYTAMVCTNQMCHQNIKTKETENVRSAKHTFLTTWEYRS